MTQADLDHFLSELTHLPTDPDTMGVRGHVLRGPNGCHRVLVTGVYLDLRPDDILSVRSTGPGSAEVEVALRSGATLRGIGPSEPFHNQVETGGIPFTILTRPPEKAHRHSIEKRRVRFHEKERDFLKKYGLFGTEGVT